MNTTNNTITNGASGSRTNPATTTLGMSFLKVIAALGLGVAVMFIVNNFILSDNAPVVQTQAQADTQVTAGSMVVSGTRTAQNAIMDPANVVKFDAAYLAGLEPFSQTMMKLQFSSEEAQQMQSALAPMAQELMGITPTPEESLGIYFIGNHILHEDIRVGFIAFEWYKTYYPNGYTGEVNPDAMTEIPVLREIIQQNIAAKYYTTADNVDVYDETIHDIWVEAFTDIASVFGE